MCIKVPASYYAMHLPGFLMTLVLENKISKLICSVSEDNRIFSYTMIAHSSHVEIYQLTQISFLH